MTSGRCVGILIQIPIKRGGLGCRAAAGRHGTDLHDANAPSLRKGQDITHPQLLVGLSHTLAI